MPRHSEHHRNRNHAAQRSIQHACSLAAENGIHVSLEIKQLLQAARQVGKGGLQVLQQRGGSRQQGQQQQQQQRDQGQDVQMKWLVLMLPKPLPVMDMLQRATRQRIM